MQALPYEGPDLHILELSGISAEEPIDSASRAPFTWAYNFLAFHDKESCLFAINELNGQLHQAAIGANVGDEVEIKAAVRDLSPSEFYPYFALYGFTSDWYFLHGETLGSTSDSTLRVAIPPNPAFAAAFASPQPEVAAALGLSSPVPSPLAGRDPPTLLAAATEAEANNNGVSSPRELSVPLTKASPPSLQHGQASEEGVAMVDGHDEKPPRIDGPSTLGVQLVPTSQTSYVLDFPST
ncbi:hypothetical protein JCM1840_005834 [Sporobolomyces johnsonii]